MAPKELGKKNIPKSKFDVALIEAHGNSSNRNEYDADGVSKETATINLIKGIKSTIDNCKYLIDNAGVKHITILSCHNGALIHDIKRELQELPDGMSFTILSSSKYTTKALPALKSLYREYLERGNDINHEKAFGELVTENPDTMIHIKITKDLKSGENKMFAVKAISPKRIEDLESPESVQKYFGTFSKNIEKAPNAKKVAPNKSLDSNLVIMAGDDKDVAFKEFFSNIRESTLLHANAKRFNLDLYIEEAFLIAAGRGKIELVEKYLKNLDLGGMTLEKSLNNACELPESLNRNKLIDLLFDYLNPDISEQGHSTGINQLMTTYDESDDFTQKNGLITQIELHMKHGASLNAADKDGKLPINQLKLCSDIKLINALNKKNIIDAEQYKTEVDYLLFNNIKQLRNNIDKKADDPSGRSKLVETIKQIIKSGYDPKEMSVFKISAFDAIKITKLTGLVRLFKDCGKISAKEADEAILEMKSSIREGDALACIIRGKGNVEKALKELEAFEYPNAQKMLINAAKNAFDIINNSDLHMLVDLNIADFASMQEVGGEDFLSGLVGDAFDNFEF